MADGVKIGCGGGGGTILVASAQYPIDQPDSMQVWREKIAAWVADGAAGGSQLLVFPEYAAIEQAAALGADVSGDLNATLMGVADQAVERVAFHVELARHYGVHILVGGGPVLGEDGAFYNAAQLVAPNGRVGVQEKLMMTPFERDWGVSPGSVVRVFDTVLGRIGVAICYDVEFPMITRSMACAGVDVVLVPSCTERVSGYSRVRTGAMARALENTIATVQSPTVGDALWSPAVDVNAGAAGIYVPAEHGVSDTGVLREGVLSEPGWVFADIDLGALARARKSGEMRNFSDWALQPGAGAMAPCPVEVISLKD